MVDRTADGIGRWIAIYLAVLVGKLPKERQANARFGSKQT